MTTGIEIGADHPVPVVFVTVGTMHHDFDRLMTWVEHWVAANPNRARVIAQHGASRLPRGAEGFVMCSREELLTLCRRCDIVVTQGGPGGIMDSRECGILPIVVPRLPQLHEVVDDHQVRFCSYMSGVGLIELATSETELHARLDAAVADPRSMRVEVDHADVEATVLRAGELIEDLVRTRPARCRKRRPNN